MFVVILLVVVCHTSSGHFEQTLRCAVDSRSHNGSSYNGKSPSASAPTAMSGPTPDGFKGLAAELLTRAWYEKAD